MTTERGLLAHIRLDVWRCQGAWSWRLLVKSWIVDAAFRPVLTLRLMQALSRHRHMPWARALRPFAWWLHRNAQLRCAVDVPGRLRVGYGFKLLHGLGVVINDRTRIGNNVTTMQGVTVGGTGSGIPVIEDEVIICANATVIGGVTLGRGAVIGAGCVVTRDVAAGTTVVGNPQREIPRRQAPTGFNSVPASVAERWS